MDLSIFSFFTSLLNKKADRIVGQIIPIIGMRSYIPDHTLLCDGASRSKSGYPTLWNKYLIGLQPYYYAWVSDSPSLTVWTNSSTPTVGDAVLLGRTKYWNTGNTVSSVGSSTQITVTIVDGGTSTQYTCIRQSAQDENNHLLPTCTEAEYPYYIATYGQCPFWTVDTANGTFRPPYIKNGTFLQCAASGSEICHIYAPGLPNITGNFYASGDQTQYSEHYTGAFKAGPDVGRRDSGQADWHTYPTLDFDASKSNSIYGNSDTVQPLAIAVRYVVTI